MYMLTNSTVGLPALTHVTGVGLHVHVLSMQTLSISAHKHYLAS